MVFSLFRRKTSAPAQAPEPVDEERAEKPGENNSAQTTVVTNEKVAGAQVKKNSGAGAFRKLAMGLAKTRKKLNDGFDRLVGAHAKLDDQFLDELEETLFSADVGADVTTRIVSGLRREVKKNLLKDTTGVVEFVKKELTQILSTSADYTLAGANVKPLVILVIGVNGSGKTTTIGKLAAQLSAEGKSTLLAAGDTFRAAAIDQLEIWADRAGCDLVRHQSGSDPSAVMFDATRAAIARGKDVMIADTAGRLHNKAHLMEELKKIKRVIGREAPGAPHETLLVLDATTGQNAVNQARMFHEAVGVTGIVLTKLDGTAKGGVVVNIMDALKIPVRLIGVGEGIDDLRAFDPEEFIAAMFSRSPDEKPEAE